MTAPNHMVTNFGDQEPNRVSQRHRAAWVALVGFGCFLVLGWVLAVAVGAALPGLGAVAALALGVLVMRQLLRRAPGVPCLTYHSVSQDAAWLPWADQISVRPETLDRHLQLIRRMGLRTVDSAEFIAARKAGKPLPENAVLLHFDDGYLDNWVAAWPILRHHRAKATMFVSTDFIAPDQTERPTLADGLPVRWDGYVSWRELRRLDASPEWTIEAHGTDHGRVPTGPKRVGKLTAQNAAKAAWMQWALTPGDKHDWYLRHAPLPLGTPVPESAPSLTARRWNGETQTLESQTQYEIRVRKVFARCQIDFARELGRAPRIFCWPQNITTQHLRDMADRAGFVATTGGKGRNTEAADPRVISRVHMGQDYAGFRSGFFDDLAVRAHIRCMQGALIWAPVLTAIGLLRRLNTRRDLTRRARPHTGLQGVKP